MRSRAAPPLILASSSQRRAAYLRELGFAFRRVVPRIDESTRRGESPRRYVRRLAEAKALAAERRAEAKAKGYEGEMCGECGNFTLVRNGTYMKCDTCGSTTGCS